MAPGPDGTLFVSIPSSGGSVLALLDRGGGLAPGWPITVQDSTSCGRPLTADDGSVRVICDGSDLPVPDNDLSNVRAFAFEAGGRSMAGWPVTLRPGLAARLIGDEMTVVQGQILTDTADVGVTISHVAWMATIAANGAIRSGTKVPMVETCCGEEWTVAPDGIAYGVGSASDGTEGSAEVSWITSIGGSGLRSGWPVRVDGIASGPAFGPGGRIVATIGSANRTSSRVLVFNRDGKAVSARSAQLPIMTAESGVDCIVGAPKSPIIAQDGAIFVFSELDPSIFALDPTLQVMPGWPFEPPSPLERPDPSRGEEGLNCVSLSLPAAGPDGTLYLPLQARSSKVGGNLVAVGPNGRVRAGWPVELTRPGSEFWSIAVGSDGTIYALAIEPEAGGASSATILALAPDSTVLYTTTIIDP
jgi:hypothetical protein